MRQPWIGGLAAALLGAAVVVAVFGLAPLDPRNQGWLLAGPLGPDPVQLWLGWTYFRHAPWAMPPGANPDYGMELGTAIYFADAIPLLALAGKALRGVVEIPQYVGPWLLACGLLQGVLGWRLIGLVTRDPLARICGAGLLALQPMLVNRMAGHTPLAGQWVILAALLLALRRGHGMRQGLAWAALLAMTALIHSYLLAMLAPLWAADWLRRAWPDRDRLEPGWGRLALESVAVPAAVLTALWAGGFFLLHGGYDTGPGHEAGTYGSWNFDLLAFLDGGMWSGLLPDLPDPEHWEAGSSYLGLGGLLLLAAGALALMRHPLPLPRRLWPLLAALLLLFAFAVTHRVTIAGHAWVLFEPPARLLAIAGALRNSERMAWPLAYALLLGAIAACARGWGPRRTGWMLLALLALQWLDLRPGIAQRHSLVAGAPSDAPRRLFDPFWAEAVRSYARVRAVSAANMGEGWESIARLAAQAGLPTDSVYMARVDEAAVAALRAKTAASLASGDYEPGTLYVLRDAESLALARASHDPARDLILQADGYWVLAPGWISRHTATR
ncbi:MAG: hypothetical protein IRY87_11410 [Acetobacteraceae bacterium]|nr:hypothetical protein [Acetobacteraceae bacterium]